MTIRKSIWVGRSPEISFKVFCEDIGEWWPGGFGGKDSKLSLAREVGGRFLEHRADGTEYDPYTPDALASNGPLHAALLHGFGEGP